MKTTHLLLLLFVAQTLSGQPDTSIIPKNQIKISPLRLLWPDRGIELNYERLFTSNFSTQVTATYITDVFKATPQKSYNQLSGFAIYLEPKYYFDVVNQSRTFLSASFGYLHCTFENIDDFLNVQADTVNKLTYFFKDTVNIDRRLFDFNINCGLQKYFKHFVFEFSAGVGLRYRDVKLSNKLYADEKMWVGRHEIFIYPHREGSFGIINIPLRIRIGYCF